MFRFLCFLWFFFCFLGSICEAQNNMYTLNMGLFTEYNDNIYLTDSDKEDEVISGFNVNFLGNRASRVSDLNFGYSLSRVFYWQESDNSAFRHNLFLNYGRYISRNLHFNLNSTYYRTEESVEPSEDVFRERKRSREPYYRVASSFVLSYEYLENSFVEMGFLLNYLQNEDPSIEDTRIYSEYLSITKDFTWWFVGFELRSTQREFETQDPVNTWGVSGDLGYKLAHNKDIYLNFLAERTQNIGKREDDYWAYNFSINYRWSPEKDQVYHFSLGYYLRDKDDTGKENEGFTFSLSYSKKFKLSSISIVGSGGYRYEYGEAQNTGFTEYYLISANYNRQLSKKLSFSVTAFYRIEDFKDRGSGEEDTYGVSLSFVQQFTPRLSGSLSYSYRAADSDYPDADYEVNTVIFMINYMFWQSKSFPIIPKLWSL